MEQDVQILLEDHPIFGQMAEGKETEGIKVETWASRLD